MKNKDLTYVVFVIFSVMCILPASAQNVIKWRTTVKMETATEGVLTVRAIVTDGWHLYGMNLPKGGPKPTVLDFSSSKGVKFIGDFKASTEPVKKKDELFDLTLTWWDKNVSFTRRFKIIGKKEDALICGKITYMACDNQNCLPPNTENVSVRIK